MLSKIRVANLNNCKSIAGAVIRGSCNCQFKSKTKNFNSLAGLTDGTKRDWLSSNCLPQVNRFLTALPLRTMATTAGVKFKLTETEGDLFSAPPSHSLAHCVGADFLMGAGIAVKFKQTYGKVDELLGQGVQTGGVATLKDKDRYIYYLVTKPKTWGSPTYDSLRSSLESMRDHMRANNINKLAIPRIGCGIDGLEWDKVTNELNNVFGKENVEIIVYNFVPK